MEERRGRWGERKMERVERGEGQTGEKQDDKKGQKARGKG
jgi:hypothetical protein